WAYGVALAVYAYHAGGARAVGLLLFARWALAAAVAPWLALLADRGSRRRVMLASNLVRVALVGGMAALVAGHGPTLAVYALAVGRDESPAASGEEPLLPSLLAGFRAIGSEPALRVVVTLTGVQQVVIGVFEVLLVVYALRVLDAGNSGVGWLNAAFGVGGVAGAGLVAALAGRKRLGADLGLGVLLWGVPMALVALWTNLGFALVL